VDHNKANLKTSRKRRNMKEKDRKPIRKVPPSMDANNPPNTNEVRTV
jgi:hypothetical protein